MLTGLHVVRTVAANLPCVDLSETELDLLVHLIALTIETCGYA
jgi:hypothetical protein